MHHLSSAATSASRPAAWGLRLLALLLALGLLAGCRAGGPGNPARSVSAFYDKYHDQPGFRSAEWSADFLQRLALVRVGKLLGGNDLSNAITGIRQARVMTFAPTSGAAQRLSREGLLSEANGLLQANRYTPLALASGDGPANFNYVAKTTGDKVSELVATGSMADALNSFVLVQVEGNFTRPQAEALAKVLPDVVRQTQGL